MILPPYNYIPVSELSKADIKREMATLDEEYEPDYDSIEFTENGVKCYIYKGKDGKFTVCMSSDKK